MKRALSLLFALALLVGLGPEVHAAAPNGFLSAAAYNYQDDRYDDPQDLPLVQLTLDGQPISGEMPGVILGGRTLAPLRLLAEGLGAEVEWLPDDSQVRVTRAERDILLTLGSATAEVDGLVQALPDGVPATILSYEGQGYTMVPARFFSETLDCLVGWDQTSYTASVSQRSYIDQRYGELLAPLETPVAPQSRLIVLDAGHGGSASGAYYEKTAEKDLTLSMTQKVETILNALGYRTLMTRREDVYMDLYDRAGVANEAGADLFVSIHCNAADHKPDFQGTYVYHYPGSETGKALAQTLQDAICAFTGSVDRGIESANFVVVRETTMPAALVETGFMTCPEELARLRDEAYQTRMAQGIAQGIIRYLNAQEAPEPVVPAPDDPASTTPTPEAPTEQTPSEAPSEQPPAEQTPSEVPAEQAPAEPVDYPVGLPLD